MTDVRILVVTKNVPWPPNSGEKQRTLGIVRALAGVGTVTVVGFADIHDDPRLGEKEGVQVRSVPQPVRRRAASLLVAAGRKRSITAGKWFDPRLASFVEEEIRAGTDVLVVEHAQLAGYLPHSVPQPRVTVLDMHNIESVLTARHARTTRSWRRLPIAVEAVALRRLERRESPRFSAVSVVSEPDRRALEAIVSHRYIDVVPNAIAPTAEPLPPAPTPTVCFVGLMSWAPNADAAVAFATEVWPQVLASVPGARLLLVGREPSSAVRALASDSITVTGTVADLTPWYVESQVALAPLLAGGGSRLKILEALAWGRPVLATTVGAEGLEDLVGRGVVVADGPTDLARELVTLLGDRERRERLGAQGAAAVRADHSWTAATAPLLERIGGLTGGR